MQRPGLFLWGLFMLLLGGGMLAWIGFNLFVERQPGTEGRSPVVPTVIGLVILGGGVYRIGQSVGRFGGGRRGAGGGNRRRHEGTSKGGSAIFHYDDRDEALAVPDRSDSVAERIGEHLAEHGLVAANVFHEIVSTHVHVDVHIVDPTPERPWITLFTTGMSDLPMSAPEGAEACRFAEVMINLSPDWELSREALDDEANYWPIRLLKVLARLPHEYDSWLWFGHSVPNGDPAEPFARGTALCGALLLPPLTLPEGVGTIPTEKGEVQMLEVVPLLADEMQFKLDVGTDELVERFLSAGMTPIVEPGRSSVLAR